MAGKGNVGKKGKGKKEVQEAREREEEARGRREQEEEARREEELELAKRRREELLPIIHNIDNILGKSDFALLPSLEEDLKLLSHSLHEKNGDIDMKTELLKNALNAHEKNGDIDMKTERLKNALNAVKGLEWARLLELSKPVVADPEHKLTEDDINELGRSLDGNARKKLNEKIEASCTQATAEHLRRASPSVISHGVSMASYTLDNRWEVTVGDMTDIYYDGYVYENGSKEKTTFLCLDNAHQALRMHEASKLVEHKHVMRSRNYYHDAERGHLLAYDPFLDLDESHIFDDPISRNTRFPRNSYPKNSVRYQLKGIISGVDAMHKAGVTSTRLGNRIGFVVCERTRNVKILRVDTSISIDNSNLENLEKEYSALSEGFDQILGKYRPWHKLDLFLNSLVTRNIPDRLEMLSNHPFLIVSEEETVRFVTELQLAIATGRKKFRNQDLIVLRKSITPLTEPDPSTSTPASSPLFACEWLRGRKKIWGRDYLKPKWRQEFGIFFSGNNYKQWSMLEHLRFLRNLLMHYADDPNEYPNLDAEVIVNEIHWCWPDLIDKYYVKVFER